MYITISAWGDPKLSADINYSEVIRKMNKEIKTDNGGAAFPIN